MLKGPEIVREEPVTIGAGAFEAARQDLDFELRLDPNAVQKRFIKLMRTDRELAMSILKSAQMAAENNQPPDEIFIETVVFLLDAIDKTRTAQAFESQLGDVA